MGWFPLPSDGWAGGGSERLKETVGRARILGGTLGLALYSGRDPSLLELSFLHDCGTSVPTRENLTFYPASNKPIKDLAPYQIVASRTYLLTGQVWKCVFNHFSHRLLLGYIISCILCLHSAPFGRPGKGIGPIGFGMFFSGGTKYISFHLLYTDISNSASGSATIDRFREGSWGYSEFGRLLEEGILPYRRKPSLWFDADTKRIPAELDPNEFEKVRNTQTKIESC